MRANLARNIPFHIGSLFFTIFFTIKEKQEHVQKKVMIWRVQSPRVTQAQ